MKKITLFAVTLMLTMVSLLTNEVKSAMADDDEYDEYTLQAPDPGENLTVVVDVEEAEPDKKISYTPTNIYYPAKESRYHVRGGVGTGIMFPGRGTPSFTGGLSGELYTSSVAVEGTFQVGNCQSGIALNSGLAVLGIVNKHLRAGVGADLLYCSNVSSDPKEKAKERVVGGSFRVELVYGHVVVGGLVGMGAITYQVPESRETDPSLYGGVNIAYRWGK